MNALSKVLPQLTIAAAVGAGLMGGLLFAFSNVVMRSLSDLPVGSAVQAMRRINVLIVNPLFLLLFLGTALLCLLLLVRVASIEPSTTRNTLMYGSLCYLVGVIGVTFVFNIPLNNQLAAAAESTLERLWTSYVIAWLRWNHIRTIAAIVSAVLLVWSAFGLGRLDKFGGTDA